MTDGICDMQLRDCDRDAEYELVLDGQDEFFDGLELERECCHAHLGWFRQEFVKERGYQMDVTEIEE